MLDAIHHPRWLRADLSGMLVSPQERSPMVVSQETGNRYLVGVQHLQRLLLSFLGLPPAG
jgi:subtilisin-like proprotein convertase family protein